MRAVVLLFLLALSVPAAAQTRFQDTLLLETRDWSVFRTLDRNDNSQFCYATTSNSQGQAFILGAFSDQALDLAITDPSWTLNETVDFVLFIDRNRWDITGTGDGASISVRLSNFDETADFLNDLTAGITVRMERPNGSEIGRFSLRGSSRAIGQLLECWEEVIAKGQPVEETAPLEEEQKAPQGQTPQEQPQSYGSDTFSAPGSQQSRPGQSQPVDPTRQREVPAWLR